MSDMCFCVFSVFCIMVWCLNVLVCFMVVLNVNIILVKDILGLMWIGVIFLFSLMWVVKIFCLSLGWIFKFFVVCFINLYFFNWWISFVRGFFFLLELLLCLGSRSLDLIFVNMVVISKYFVVSFNFSDIMVFIYFIYCLVILVMGSVVILNFCFLIR